MSGTTSARVPKRRVETREQLHRLVRAKAVGGLCGWCGRALTEGEPVYIERFRVGRDRARPGEPTTHRTRVDGPVGVECASPEMLAGVDGQQPRSCAGCGRGVFYRAFDPRRRQTSCSLTLPNLGHEACFSFENGLTPREAQAAGLAQPYKVFAQIVTIEAR